MFRAEDSNTHRHMTEFTGLDLEVRRSQSAALTGQMAFEEHYDEVIDMLDALLRHVFTGLQTKYASEIEAVRKQFPSEPFTFPEKTVKLHFSDAVKLLREAGREVADYEDFDTPTERFLGQLVKEKFGTDYYILNKCVAEMFNALTPQVPAGRATVLHDARRRGPEAVEQLRLLVRAHTAFGSSLGSMRGEEILSGAQRVHTARLLEENMRRVGIEPDSMKEYIDGFRCVSSPLARR